MTPASVCKSTAGAGGTGFAARDVTPEATKQVCHKLATGLMTQMQLAASQLEPMAAVSRAVIGGPSTPFGAVKSVFRCVRQLLHS